jgi:hypothetical protein
MQMQDLAGKQIGDALRTSSDIDLVRLLAAARRQPRSDRRARA